MDLAQAIKQITGETQMDVTKILAIVQAIVAAAPAIEEGIADISIYVSAIETMIKNGGNPTDDQWASLKQSLDTGSATLAAAAEDATQQIDETKE